jgi:hypothetical protein
MISGVGEGSKAAAEHWPLGRRPSLLIANCRLIQWREKTATLSATHVADYNGLALPPNMPS